MPSPQGVIPEPVGCQAALSWHWLAPQRCPETKPPVWQPPTTPNPEQLERLERALSESLLGVAQLDSLDPTFVMLVKEGRLGIGECAAIAIAVAKDCPLVIDDKKAANTTSRVAPQVPIERTETLIVTVIRAGVLDVATADAIKAEWESKHRFRLTFGSFAEKI